MAWDPPWDTAIHRSHAPGVGAGEPRASAATRGAEGAPAAAPADSDGADLLGRAVEALAELAEFAAGGAARDRGRLAPAGVQALLGVEESTPTRSAHDRDGAPRSDSAGEPRQSSLGCAEDPRRAAEARPDGIAGDGFEVPVPGAAAAVAGVAHVFEESRQGSDRVGFLHGAHGDLSSPVRARGAEPQPAPAGAFQCHGTSDRGVDRSAAGRGVRAGGDPTASDPGPRPGLWRTIFASGQDVGHPGSGHCAPLALAKRLCRARDWIDSTGMP